MPKGKLPSAGEAASAAEKKRREIEALNSGTGGLFERLLKVAGGGGGGGNKAADDKAAAAAVAAEPHSTSTSTGSSTSANGAHASSMASAGRGSGAAAAQAAAGLVRAAGSCRAPPGVDAAAYEAARSAFLAAHSAEYGYGGVIDDLYPQEVGAGVGGGV